MPRYFMCVFWSRRTKSLASISNILSFKICARNANKILEAPLQSYFAAFVYLVLNEFAFLLETRNRCPRNNDTFACIWFAVRFKIYIYIKLSYVEWLYPQFQRDDNRETSNEKTRWKFAVGTTHDENAAQHYSALFFMLFCERLNNFRTTALFFDTTTWR